MTKLPAENRDVEGIEYSLGFPKYKVGPLCAVPGCSRLADHAHHIWRRSFLTGDYGWVKLWDGTIVQNLCGLCYMHHNLVTENRAQILWRDGFFAWSPQNGGEYLLDPQPKIWAVTSNDPEPEEHTHDGPASQEKCPTCQQTIRRKDAAKKEGKRNREKWSITVPVDARENGAAVLDTLMEECQKLFGHDETKALRYFTLVQALSLVVQHGDRMMGDS